MKRVLLAAGLIVAVGVAVAVTMRDRPALTVMPQSATVAEQQSAVATDPQTSAPAKARVAVLYKNPQCSCCEAYAAYLRSNGYSVTVKPTHDLSLFSKQQGISSDLQGCHTMLIGGYVVEGHVPVNAINRLLTERPQIKGISLPGMPQGAPGMTGAKERPFTIYEVSDGKPKVYAVE